MFGRMTSDDGDLIDESEANLCSKFSGTLVFDKPDDSENCDDSKSGAASLQSFESDIDLTMSSSQTIQPETAKKTTGQRIVFEVISARTVNNIRKKYVSYTLLIKKAPGIDRSPALIERRYSDFLNLFLSLKKRYPDEMQSINYFPKKTVLNNYSPDVITFRSKAFERFLYDIYGMETTCYSVELAEFLYNREVREAHGNMRCGKFEDAIPLLENAYFLQEKVAGDCHLSTMNTLCELIAVHNALDNTTEAHKFAQIALCQFLAGHHENSELYPSLLQLSIRLSWTLGKEKRELEKKLQALSQSKGIRTDSLPTLLDIVMSRCK